ncbi:MAG: IclR family transcriptional regulator [Alcaligenaceae bacterium]|uniref:IclR family transcriptional regulator n=1 Tax=Advenella mandrilli TaxID=2800330 RepID=A0ABS1EET3_9BURK|nr:IclR family transcriptional regulator [Advenella mandrilli]MBK1781768.1 IclR family transcriptional regulator [Advenella mandrilli]NLY65906.1 IclR family transcriptional regulator [Alcaligenaceae bacterium]
MSKKSSTLSIADKNPSAGGVAAVDRALSLLVSFNKDDEYLSLMELANRTNMYKSTILRLLASLEHYGLVRRTEEGRYGLGETVAQLYGVYNASFSQAEVIVPVLKALVEKTKESASYHVISGKGRLCLHRINSPLPISYQTSVGDILPLDKGSGGRVLQAFNGAVGEIYDQIRQEGVIVMDGDRIPDLAGVSAAVFNAHNELVGAITLTMPSSRLVPSFKEDVLEAALSLSRKLGYVKNK